MGMFRRTSRQGKPRQRLGRPGPAILNMKLAGTWVYRPSVYVYPLIGGDIPGVHLQAGEIRDWFVGRLTEDEARMLAQALLDAIEQSKGLTAREPG
jgi:hypothetical protein